MRQKRKTEWIEIARRGRNHAVLFVELIAQAYQRRYVARNMGWHFNPKSYRQFSGARWMRAVDVEGYIEYFRRAEEKEPGFLIHQAKLYQRAIAAMRAFGNRVARRSWSNVSNETLSRFFEDFCERLRQTTTWLFNYILINRYLPDEIAALVAQKIPDVNEQNRCFTNLFSLSQFTETHREKLALLRIAQSIRRQKLIARSPNLRTILRHHCSRFGYLNLYVMYGRPYTERDLLRRIKLLTEKKIAHQLQELARVRQANTRFRSVVRCLNLDRRTVQKIQGARESITAATLWEESFTFMVWRCYPLFEEIGKRIGLTYDQLIEARYREIFEFLASGRRASAAFRATLAERYCDSAVIFDKGRIRVLVGSILQRLYREQKATEADYRAITSLKGQPASPGKVCGRVSVTRSIYEIEKVKRGDVLVASATTPAHVPAMERAVAIVTDEGGLLCHAAIVSREFGIPCVVGTKIATKVFKDGDRVEVDATKGIVRKL